MLTRFWCVRMRCDPFREHTLNPVGSIRKVSLLSPLQKMLQAGDNGVMFAECQESQTQRLLFRTAAHNCLFSAMKKVLGICFSES